MKRIAVIFIGLGLGCALAWAMPSQITFQGTLKQQGVPVNTTKNMQFSFVDATGASIPGTTPISVANVQVTNSLFAVQLPLDPTIPWEQYTPFIQVSIEGQILSPNQPINANLYAVSAIPQGMIMMSTGTCPAGWSIFTGLQGRFPVGADPSNPEFTLGVSGGNLTHSHTLTTFTTYTNAAPGGNIGWSSEIVVNGTPAPDALFNSAAGPGNTTFHQVTKNTDSQSNLPPYSTVVFCIKQ